MLDDGLSTRQTHGLVISSVWPDVFRRVGYFWTSDEEMARRSTTKGKKHAAESGSL
jgi:hypothetical protein